jgi:hypothetical protein
MEAQLRIVPDSNRDHLFFAMYYEIWENLFLIEKVVKPVLALVFGH